MANLNERNCAHCGALFNLEYTGKDGYTYLLNTMHCSKSCASKSNIKANKGCIIPDVGKEALKQKALSYVSMRGTYCTMEEICSGVGHSSKTFIKHGLRTSDINNEAGFARSGSIFQKKVGEFLSEQFDDVEVEKKFEGLVGNTGYPLRVDFYIPEINTVVEADGVQHKYPTHPWAIHKNGTVAEYDQIKDDFCREKGIRIVRIPFKRNLKESDVSSRLS